MVGVTVLSNFRHSEQDRYHLIPSCHNVRYFGPCLHIAPVCREFVSTITSGGLSKVLKPRPQIPCLITAIENSSCAITNQTCICYDEDLSAQATACIQDSCTVREALSTKNLTSTSCGIPPTTGPSYVPVFMTMTVLCAGSVLLRVVARLKAGYPVWWDDFIISLSFVGSALCSGGFQPRYHER